jgi:hypothetical protein
MIFTREGWARLPLEWNLEVMSLTLHHTILETMQNGHSNEVPINSTISTAAAHEEDVKPIFLESRSRL